MSLTRRKRPDESTHDYQHSLLAERKALWLGTPKKERTRRRERNKSAWWTLTGHLRSQHGYRGSFLRMTWEEAETIHTQLHEKG